MYFFLFGLAWNIRRLIDELFVPATQQTSVLYCRLSDLNYGNPRGLARLSNYGAPVLDYNASNVQK